LTSAGYDVVKAGSGQAGLSKAKTERPDLIILDMMMPEMSGEEVAQELKIGRETRSIPILFLTALFTKRDEAPRDMPPADKSSSPSRTIPKSSWPSETALDLKETRFLGRPRRVHPD